MLRKIMDKVGTMFETNKFLRPLYPMYEAIDTFLYTPKYVAAGSVHVRDSLCLKRTMTTVMIAVVPCGRTAFSNSAGESSEDSRCIWPSINPGHMNFPLRSTSCYINCSWIRTDECKYFIK